MRFLTSLVCVLLVSACAREVPSATVGATAPCDVVGAYRLEDGTALAIGPSSGDSLRFRLSDGQSGVLLRQRDGSFLGGLGWASTTPPVNRFQFGGCDAPSSLSLDGKVATARRVQTQAEALRIEADGVTLAGRLVLPQDAKDAPIAVLTHRQGSMSMLAFDYWQHLLPAMGVGVLVYDKRGTGASGGDATESFDILAADALAAFNAAKTRARPGQSIGFLGTAQGGFTAVMAAASSEPDFLIVINGQAHKPAFDDQEEVLYRLRTLGYGEEVLAKAREVTNVTRTIVTSRFEEGWDALEEIKARYGEEPWFSEIRGSYSERVLTYSPRILRTFGPDRAPERSWDFDPQPILQRLDAPQLWVLAGRDSEAPSARSLAYLRQLQNRRPTIDILLYEEAGHGNIIYETDAAGQRQVLSYAPGYFEAVAKWVTDGTLTAAAGARIVSGETPAPARPADGPESP
ncbi:MAG: alpha/beta hydrolase family protein [Rhodothalassiaceae bacterium]